MTRWVLLSVAFTAAAVAGSAWYARPALDNLPERVAVHWDWKMRPDGWTTRAEVQRNPFWLLYGIPTGMAVVTVLGLALPWLSPRPFAVDTFRATFDYGIAIAVGLIGYLHAVILYGILGGAGLSPNYLFAGLFLFFALMGNVIGKVRKNFWMGVRTPWTLASDRVWDRTHRLSAWLWTGAGLVGFVLALVLPELWAFALLPVMLVVILVPVPYSLWLYKRLEREGKLGEPAGTGADVAG
jgi:uncharacterized membrane protein